MTGANERITAEATSWPGVSAGYGERGEWGFSVGRRQIGHLHGDRVAHFGFPRSQWEDLMRAGRVERHPIDRPGWASRRIEGEADVVEVLALLRLNYDRAAAKHGVAA
ncbi:MAG: luciferase family protein [Solirubrobacteraceae bacterium]